MAEVQSFKSKDKISEQFLSLNEVSETFKEYPIIVRILPAKYENSDPKGLTEDTTMLIEKPKWMQYVLVRILGSYTEQQVNIGTPEEQEKEQNKYVGKEYLIPMAFPGTLKLINKAGRQRRYLSVEQLIRDLPSFIRIDQETGYSAQEQCKETSKLAAGTTLEVKRVFADEQCRYIECESTDTSATYTFREDFPINCTAIDDPGEHTLLNLAEKSVVLPKDARFQHISEENIIIKNADEASDVLSALHGPIKILKFSIRRNMFITWAKPEGTCLQTVGLIPNKIWNSQVVQVKQFSSESKKQEYIQKHFGERSDSSFLESGLYLMKHKESDVIWLLAPNDNTATGKQVDYKNTAPILGNEPTLLPVRKVKKEGILQTIKGKARISFDKVHERLLKRTNQTSDEGRDTNARNKTLEHSLMYNRSEYESSGSHEDERSQWMSKTYKFNKNRPLPALPPKTDINVTDDDKLEKHVGVENKQEGFQNAKENSLQKSSDPTFKALARYPDLNKVRRANQTSEDFYSYSCEELVECFKMCSLQNFAIYCQTKKLDGAFFRNVDLDELMSEPFNLSSIDVLKVKQSIEVGWRPKPDSVQN